MESGLKAACWLRERWLRDTCHSQVRMNQCERLDAAVLKARRIGRGRNVLLKRGFSVPGVFNGLFLSSVSLCSSLFSLLLFIFLNTMQIGPSAGIIQTSEILQNPPHVSAQRKVRHKNVLQPPPPPSLLALFAPRFPASCFLKDYLFDRSAAAKNIQRTGLKVFEASER